MIEHDTIVRRPPADMAAPVGDGETEPPILIACSVQVGDTDDGMIDAVNGVGHLSGAPHVRAFAD